MRDDDRRYGIGTFWQRRRVVSPQWGRLLSAPLGALKLVSALVLTVAGIAVIIMILALVLGGHVSHV